MNLLKSRLFSQSENTDTAMSGFGASENSSIDVRGSRDYSAWFLVLFLVGTIVDYGGGFYVKQGVFALTVLYLLTQRRAHAIWLRCLPDLAVVILIPAGITLLHLIFSSVHGFDDVLWGVWRCLGSPSYFIFFPLIYLVGAERTAKWIVVILTVLALATVLIMLAHINGLIDIFQYTEFMTSHRLALFGTDTRGLDLGLENLGLPSFGAAQAFPIGFALALILHPVFAVVLALATLLGTQRGQVFGILLALSLMFVQMRRQILARFRQVLKTSKNILTLVMLILLVVVVAAVAFYMGDVISLIRIKYELLLSGQDESSLVRLGHLAGYWQCIDVSPFGLLWGFGPTASIYNMVTGEQVFMTEMVILMYMFWYGWIYTLTFYLWIGLGMLRLRRHSRKRFDAALLSACAVLVIIGNINPVMLTPLAFIFLALLRARLLELEISGILLTKMNPDDNVDAQPTIKILAKIQKKI